LEGSEDLPAIFEGTKPAAERDLVRYATEELLGWDVKRVFVETGSYCGHGMGAEDIEKNFRRKPTDVVLAKANASGTGKEVVQESFVLDESLGAGKAAQGPGHLAGDPKPGESLVQRFFCVLTEEVEHGLGVESPCAEVGFLGGDEPELVAALGFPDVNPSLLEEFSNLEAAWRICDVEDSFAGLQAAADVLRKNGPALLLASVEEDKDAFRGGCP
jgi:hypothetical protein